MTQQQHDVHSRERERYNNMSEHILPNISMEHDISKCHLNTTLKYLRRHRRRHSIILHIILSLSLSLSAKLLLLRATGSGDISLNLCGALLLPPHSARHTPAPKYDTIWRRGGRRVAVVVVALQGRSGGRRVVWGYGGGRRRVGGWFALPSGGLPTRAKNTTLKKKSWSKKKKTAACVRQSKSMQEDFSVAPASHSRRQKKQGRRGAPGRGRRRPWSTTIKKLTSK